MKPMTEQEAAKAMREAFPWAAQVGANQYEGCASVWAESSDPTNSRTVVGVDGHAPTLRAAVAKAIKAWERVTKKRAIKSKRGKR